MKYGALFKTGKIGSLELKNRTVMNPMGTLGMCDSRGIPNEAWGNYYVERAKGGVGLIITGVHPVSNKHEQMLDTNMPHMYQDYAGYILATRLAIEAIHAHGAKIFCQLTAGWGRSAIPGVTLKAVAPSAQPNRFDPSIIVPEMTREQIKDLVTAFGDSAATAKKAGYDGIEVHAVHEGYLLDQFTMEFYNKRTDEYGGSLENRYRIIREIMEELRSRVGERFPISIRYSSKSMIKGFGQGILPQEVDTVKDQGRDLDEGVQVAKMLEEMGFDALNVDVGTYDSWYWNHPPMYFDKGGMYMDYCKPVCDAVDIPIIMSGRMDDPDLAKSALEGGYCDFIGYARPLLADAELVNKIANDKLEEIRPCLSCHDGCLARQASVGRIACAVNPRVAREGELLSPAPVKKKVSVIGGGPAGLEVARIAAMRGHSVTLHEKTARLGGNLRPASVPSNKHDDRALIKWFEHQMKLHNVEVKLNSDLKGDEAELESADHIIVATGSLPLDIPFERDSDGVEMVLADDVLMGRAEAKDTPIIVGGGLVGSELALHLAQNDRHPTIVDMVDDIVGGPHGVCPANYFMLKELMVWHKIRLQLKSKLKKITAGGVIVETKDGEIDVAGDQVILAIGYRREGNLPSVLYERFPGKTDVIGDAKTVKTIMNAVYEGYEIGRTL